MSISKRKFIVCAFALITFATACVKNKTTPVLTPLTSTIAQIIKGGSNLTILDSALSKSGLYSIFDEADTNYTFFTPTDAAFMAAGIYDSTVNRDSVGYWQRFIRYQTLGNTKLTLAMLQSQITSPNTKIPSGSPNDTLFLTIDSTGFLYVNGNLVTQADVMAKNGVIHVISGVLIPPVGNLDSSLYSLAQKDTTLTYFVQALKRTAGQTTDLVALLSTGVYTVFAPTNAAFRLTADSTPTAISVADPDSLVRLLQTHIISGRVFSSDFPTDSVRFSIAPPTVTWPKGDSLFFTSTIGNTIKSKGDSTQTGFLRTNILATNGVIHKINQVLFPYYPF